MSKPKRRTVKKDAGSPASTTLLNEMPLSNRRVAPGALVFKSTHVELHIGNLEEPIVWQLDAVRKAAEPTLIAKAFAPLGSRYTRTLKDIPAALLAAAPAPGAPGATTTGATELGLQSDDDHEYFLSKFGELCGVLRVQRKADGSWKAGLAKTNLPRVLTKEAVSQGLMPPLGSSGLPKSLEAVVPEQMAFWKAADDASALALRNQLVESGFFDEASVQPVDGELRKVVTRHFLYDPAEHAAPEQKSFGDRVSELLPEAALGFAPEAFSPMADARADDALADDWIEQLDANDAVGKVAVLSPVDRTEKAREMARAVKTLKGEFLIEHDDTRANRAAFSGLGVLFKVDGLDDRIFCSSYAPPVPVTKLEDVVVRSIKFQNIPIDLDRPKGFVQTGKDADGNAWEREYLCDYGFFPGTQGGDGDQLDVFVGPNADSERVFWVTQQKADGAFDEYKVFVGFDTPREARDCFTSHIPARFLAGLDEIPMGALKSLLGVEHGELAKRIAKVAGVSYEQLRQSVNAALDEKFPTEEPSGCFYHYVEDLFDETAIYTREAKTWQVGFAYDATTGKATFTSEPVQVMRAYKPIGGAEAAPAPTVDPNAELALSAPEGTTKRAPRFMVHLGKRTTLKKEERYVLGVVLEPDVVDAQYDTYSAEEVRSCAEKFMTDFRNMGLMHKQLVNEKVRILESYIAPTDMQLDGGESVKKGTWLMGVRVNDDTLWDQVKKGGLTGFSIGGSAIRKPEQPANV